MPFLVSIPSMIRFWYREAVVALKRKTLSQLPTYDSIWFEGTASKIGTQYYNHFVKIQG